MPRYINKRNITIFIGIAVAILIVLSTASFALPTLGAVIDIDHPLIQPIINNNFIHELFTKIYLP